MNAIGVVLQKAFWPASSIPPNSLRFAAVRGIYSLDPEPGKVCLKGTTHSVLEKQTYDLLRTQSIIWDEASGKFMLQYGRHYTNHPNVDVIYYRQNLTHGTILNQDFIPGAIIDQEKGEILLPNGVRIVGATGEIKQHNKKTIVKPQQP